MTYAELGDTVKKKYPQYASHDSTELGQLVVKKHPEYQSRITEESFGQGLKAGITGAPGNPTNFMGEAGRFIGKEGLPIAGGIAGTFMGPEGSVLGEAAGAGLGQAAGRLMQEGAQDVAAQSNSTIPAIPAGQALRTAGTEGLIAGAGQAAMPGLMTLGKKAVSGIGIAAADVLQTMTGAPREAFIKVFENPKMLNAAKSAIGQLEQSDFVQSIEAGVRALGSKLGKLEDRFSGFYKPGKAVSSGVSGMVDLDLVQREVRNELLGFRRLPSGAIEGKVREVSSLPPSDLNTVLDTINGMKKKGKISWGNALQLRRRIDQQISWKSNGLPALGEAAERHLVALREGLNEALGNALPIKYKGEWKAANTAYSEGLSAMRELRSQAVGATPEQTGTKLLGSLRKGAMPLNRERASKLGEDTLKALDEIENRVVNGQLKDWFAQRGIGHWIGPMGALGTIAGGLGYQEAGEVSGGIAAATSPRLMGHATAMAGRVASPVQAALSSPAAPTSLRALAQALAQRAFGQNQQPPQPPPAQP